MNRHLKYEAYILDCIQNDENTLTTPQEKIAFCYARFISEYGWLIRQKGEFNALVEWLQGLAINIDYTYHDIFQRAVQLGRIKQDATDQQVDRMQESYWAFMAMRLTHLFNKYEVRGRK